MSKELWEYFDGGQVTSLIGPLEDKQKLEGGLDYAC